MSTRSNCREVVNDWPYSIATPNRNDTSQISHSGWRGQPQPSSQPNATHGRPGTGRPCHRCTPLRCASVHTPATGSKPHATGRRSVQERARTEPCNDGPPDSRYLSPSSKPLLNDCPCSGALTAQLL